MPPLAESPVRIGGFTIIDVATDDEIVPGRKFRFLATLPNARFKF